MSKDNQPKITYKDVAAIEAAVSKIEGVESVKIAIQPSKTGVSVAVRGTYNNADVARVVKEHLPDGIRTIGNTTVDGVSFNKSGAGYEI